MNMSRDWKEKLSSSLPFPVGREFRYGVQTIPASSIVAQFFYEMKVEQDFLHGEIETEEKAEGDLLHEQLLAMEPTTREKLIDGIEKRKLYVAAFHGRRLREACSRRCA